MQGWNLYRREWQPIATPNDPDAYSTCSIGQSIGEIEKILANDDVQKGILSVPLSPQVEARIISEIGPPSPAKVAQIVNHGHVHGIIEKVKTALLSWTLDLEEAGISGDGMAFTAEEKESAKTVSVTHNNYYAEVVQTIVQAAQMLKFSKAARVDSVIINESSGMEAISRVAEEIKKGFASLNLSQTQKIRDPGWPSNAKQAVCLA